MATIEAFLKFVDSYPAWAKLAIVAGLLFSLAVVLLSPRSGNTNSAATDENSEKTTFLRIGEVKLYPSDENIDIQIYAIVNNTRYKHPSVGGVEWMKAGPSMSPKIIELPDSDTYSIRFELKYKTGGAGSAGESLNITMARDEMMISQVEQRIVEYPFSETYKLYKVNDNSRASSVSASVDYTLYQE